MKDRFYITRQILNYRLSKHNSIQEEKSLFQQFFSLDFFYIITVANTPISDVADSTIDAYIEDRCMPLFAAEVDAVQKASEKRTSPTLCEWQVLQISAGEALSIIRKSFQEKNISSVCLCGNSPVIVKIELDHIFCSSDTQASEFPLTEIYHSSSGTPEKKNNPENYLLVPEIRLVLNTTSAEARRKIDPSDAFTNLSRMLEKLIQVNSLDMSFMDSVLNLPRGFTANLCRSPKSNTTPKAIVIKYLQFFSLSEYLYVYKGQCAELSSELSSLPDIDPYEVIPAGVKTVERFKLCDIKRGKDKNNAFVYQLSLRSSVREVCVIVSNNYKMILGKEYELIGLSPSTDLSVKAIHGACTNTVSVPPSQEEMERVLVEIAEKKPQQKQGRGSTSIR